jgi:histidine ammonia-lyase
VASRSLRAATDLDPGVILHVADGGQVQIGPGLLQQVQSRCDEAREMLRRGEPVYGVNTGMGAFSGVRLTRAEQLSHQRNLMLARATGGPPWLPARDVRAIFAVRLRTFLSGDAGVSAELCQRLLDFLAAGITPAVPQVAAGCAGEIVPLAHAFGPLVGIGRVLAAGGRTRPATDALAEQGLAGFAFGPKEGIALLQGVPGATALALLGHHEAGTVLAMMEGAAALSIAAVRAPADPYSAACARGDEVLGLVLGRLRTASGSGPAPRMLQAPASFRVAGHVLANFVRAYDGLSGAIERALAGVTDSPAFLDGQFISTAGFHGIDLAAHCDQLTAAVAHAAEVSAARTHRLLDARVTGLPAQLAARPGPDAGLVAVHKRAAGEVHAIRRQAIPSALGTIETSGGQEDVQSFAWAAATALRTALQQARVVTACELLTSYQAMRLAGPPWPSGFHALVDRLARLIEPIEVDRPFGEDIERLASGSWLTG